MLTLAFDTATPWGRFALAEDGRLLQYRPLNVMGSYADSLLLVIREILAENNRDATSLDGLGIVTGPGSFTGLRIGVATAKALAYGLDCFLVGVDSLAAMAAALLEDQPEVEFAVPALDARRGEIFSGLYRRRESWVEELVAPGALPPERWWQRVLSGLPDPELAVYGGDGTALLLGQGPDLRPELARTGVPHWRPWSAAHPPTARTLACAMGKSPQILPRVDPFALVPSYLRLSDAELNRNLDLTPRRPSTEIDTHTSGAPDHE